MRTGTMVDATLMDAPRSTRKEHPWSFGMKAPIGVDCRSRRIHSVAATAAPMHDSQGPSTLLQGEETRVRGDAAYPGSRRGDARPSATCSGPHPWKGESESGVDRARALVPSRQSEGGASVSGFQTLLRPLQGTRPGLGEERQSAARRLWAGRSVHGSTVCAAFHVEKVCRLHADEVDWTATAVLRVTHRRKGGLRICRSWSRLLFRPLRAARLSGSTGSGHGGASSEKPCDGADGMSRQTLQLRAFPPIHAMVGADRKCIDDAMGCVSRPGERRSTCSIATAAVAAGTMARQWRRSPDKGPIR